MSSTLPPPPGTIYLHVDLMSQPCRTCALFCRTNGLAVQEVPVLLSKGHHRQPEYLQRNPLGKVPLLEVIHQGAEPFRLPESAAILSYLADTNQVPEHWLPRSDREAWAKVEAALHWYHTLRAGLRGLMFNKALGAGHLNMDDLQAPAQLSSYAVLPNEALAQEGLAATKRALPDLERTWLANGEQAFVGGAKPCVADLLMSCELEQLSMLNKERHGTDIGEILGPHPHIKRWMAAVAAATAPHYEKVHETLRRVANELHGCVSPAPDKV